MESYTDTLTKLKIDSLPKLNALQALFNRVVRFGIRHGDLKDDNVVYRVENGVYDFRLIDFGNADFLDYHTEETKDLVMIEILIDWFLVLSFYNEAMSNALEGKDLPGGPMRDMYMEEERKNYDISREFGLLPRLYRQTVASTTSNPVVVQFRAWIDTLVRYYAIIYNSLSNEQREAYNPITPAEFNPNLPPITFVLEEESSESD